MSSGLLYTHHSAVDSLILHFSLTKGLDGSAAPAIDGDELDVTVPKQPQQPEAPKFAQPKVPSESDKAVDADEGLSLLQKLMIVGLIVAICVVFVKSRQANRAAEALRQKSMA